MSPLLPSLSALLLIACASTTVPVSRLPDGSVRLACDGSLGPCIQKAEELCKGRGYVVLGGVSKRELFGAEGGLSRVEVRKGELLIRCVDRSGDLPPADVSAKA